MFHYFHCGALARRLIAACCLGSSLLLGACGTSPVIPSGKFPPPVLNKVPLSIGLYMDSSLRNYVHLDKPADSARQEVHVGAASQALFSEFLAAQFHNMSILSEAPGAGRLPHNVQAILQPIIREVQIASPKTDKDSFHEAWIKYSLVLMSPSGEQITSWDVPAYGKHRAPDIGGGNASLTSAVREAMRDAAAGMALIFRDGEAIRQRVAAASARTQPAGSDL